MGPIVTIRSAEAPEAVVAVTVVLPADTATTNPDPSTRATVGSALVQPTTAPGTIWPRPSRTEADRRTVSPGATCTAAPCAICTDAPLEGSVMSSVHAAVIAAAMPSTNRFLIRRSSLIGRLPCDER